MKNNIILSICLCLMFVTTSCAQRSIDTDRSKLDETLRLINTMYVDDVKSENLSDAAIRAMLHELDPHSAYLDKNEVKLMNEPLEANFDGIGIAFNVARDTLNVMEVISGGPSEKVGILPGDKIIFVDDSLIAGVKIANDKIISKLRGKKGTIVNVKIKRAGEPELLSFAIKRDKIPIHSIDASYMIDNETGYIRLARFSTSSGFEVFNAIKALKEKGMKNLIFDVTSNGGGLLQSAIEIVNQFLKKEQLIVYTEGKNQPRYTERARGKGLLMDGKLIVLVDQNSASASEILAGAVQDWDRGVIIGRPTFGKGLVQRQIPLSDGTMIRLTVAKYYTPSGRCIQRPYSIGKFDEYELDVYTRFKKGELMHADSIHFADSLKYETLHNQRTVYGGGGIMPDLFVPLDTTSVTKLHIALNAQGILAKVTQEYVSDNRSKLKKEYSDLESFDSNFEVSDNLYSQIKKYANEAKIKWNDEQFETSKNNITRQIKAIIARDIFDTSAFYEIINGEDRIYQEAVKLINDDERYNLLLSPKKSK